MRGRNAVFDESEKRIFAAANKDVRKKREERRKDKKIPLSVSQKNREKIAIPLEFFPKVCYKSRNLKTGMKKTPKKGRGRFVC